MPTSGETFWEAVARVATAQRKIPDAIRRLADVPSAPINMDRLRAIVSRKERRMAIISTKAELDELIANRCAILLHETYRTYQRKKGATEVPTWGDVPEEEQEEIRESVRILMSNPDITGEKFHSLWMKNRSDQGWVYGPVRSKKNKTDPLIRPYEEISPVARSRGDLFLAMIQTADRLLRMFRRMDRDSK